MGKESLKRCMEEGLAQRSQGFLLLLLLLKCSGICCFSSGFVACGLLGTPGEPLSVPPVYPDGTLGRGHIARRWRRRLRGHTGLHAHMLLLTAVDGLSSCRGDSDNRDSHSSRDVFEACEQRHSLGFSLSPSKGLLLPSSPCSFVWVQEEADVSLAVCSPVPPFRSPQLICICM